MPPLGLDTLLERWNSPESELVEWKPSLAQTDSIYKTVCAFANDFANRKEVGVVFIGRNNDGTCSHLEIDDTAILEFVNRIRTSGSILPLPEISCEWVSFDDCRVLALIVNPSHSTPVQYAQQVFIRQGASTHRAKPDEITALTERRINPTFDGRATNGAVLDDLDLFYLQETYIPSAVSAEVLAENGRTLNEQLASLRILTPRFQPTNLGILLGGKDARRFLPCAYIQFSRIDGLEIGDPVQDQAEISGRLADVLRLTFDKLVAHNDLSLTATSDGRMVEQAQYPMGALRELVANAVVHRNYESSNAPIRITWFNDRIEIHNPGGPYGHVTDTNFGQPNVTDYRNPELAAALKYLGYVERFGSGIAKVRRSLSQNGNPTVHFEPRKSENYVLAVVRKTGSP